MPDLTVGCGIVIATGSKPTSQNPLMEIQKALEKLLRTGLNETKPQSWLYRNLCAKNLQVAIPATGSETKRQSE